MSFSPVIETRALSKVFGPQRALDGVNLQVAPSAIGLLGPNGAGKSTLIKCLLQLQPITSGSAKLLGREVGREGREIRKRLGYTPEQDCHIPGMAGCEYVTYCAQLCGLPFQAARQRAHEMLDFVGMGQERYRKADTYSTGMKQRLKLAQAIVHDPEIVFLDEPTNGLDPKGQATTAMIPFVLKPIEKCRQRAFAFMAAFLPDGHSESTTCLSHATVANRSSPLPDRMIPCCEAWRGAA
jgi:ABC-2 type transport system ATP-binding protein